jgi:hypothetical protein
MKTTPGQGEKVPQARIGLNDVRALLGMLTAYLAYVRKAVPPSQKRETKIRVLQGMRGRLATVLAAPYQREDTPIWLTRPELEALEEAMSSFVQLVREMIPVSNSRDETLREIKGFRDTLQMMLSRSQC